MRLVLTGAIRSGKSTVVRDTLRITGETVPDGFFARPVTADGRVSGYAISTWAGESRVFARRQSPPSPGFHGFEIDPSVFEGFAVEILRSISPGHLLVLDELGIMEQSATRFVQAVGDAFRRSPRAIVVVQLRAVEFWLPRLAKAGAMELLRLEDANRSGLPTRMAALLTFGEGSFPPDPKCQA